MKLRASSLFIVLIPIAVVVAKAVLVPPNIFTDAPISDEVYYVKVGGYLLYSLGVIKEQPQMPYDIVPAEFTFIDGYYEVNVTMNSNVVQVVPVQHGWSAPPIVVRPALPSLLYSLRWLAGYTVARLVVLILFSASLAVFTLWLAEKHGILAPIAVGAVYAVDGLVFRFSYVMMLDSLMIAFMLLAVSSLAFGRRCTSLLFLSLSAASKEYAAVMALAFSAHSLFVKKSVRWAVAYAVAPSAALVASYLINVVAVPADVVLRSIVSPPLVYDVTCRDLCLLGVYSEWGAFNLFVPFVWLWIVVALVKSRLEPSAGDVSYVVYLVALINILFAVVAGFVRTIYNFYYAPAVALSPLVVADVASYARRRLRNRATSRSMF